jgi:type I restriction enzyme S subunit
MRDRPRRQRKNMKTGFTGWQKAHAAASRVHPVRSVHPVSFRRHIVSELDTLQAEVDALKHLQAKTAAELDALLPALLDRAFKGEL